MSEITTQMGKQEVKIQKKKIKFLWLLAIIIGIWFIVYLVNIIHQW